MSIKDNKIIIEASRKYINIQSCLIREMEITQKMCNSILKNSIVLIDNDKNVLKKIIRKGTKIEVIFQNEEDGITPHDGKLDIIYEDLNVLVLNKFAGESVYSKDTNKITVASKVKFYFLKSNLHTKIRFVNRLDYNTSGIIIIAKNAYAHSYLQKQVEERTIVKKYIAYVNGIFDYNNLEITSKISSYCDDDKKYFIDDNGLEAKTIIEKCEQFEDISKLYIEIKTGRTHQIRVHLSSMGFPIVGDELYGFKNNSISRQALHAYEYCVKVPLQGHLKFIAPIPKDLLVF